jgi:hypothetical protein
MLIVFLFALAGALFPQEHPKWNITQIPEVAKAGERITVEITDLTPSPALQMDWTVKNGEGRFDGDTTKKRVVFVPTKPGDVVTIVCNISGGLKTEIEYTINIAPDSATGTVAPAAPQAKEPSSAPKPRESPPAQKLDPFPTGSVVLDKLIDPNVGLIIPAGWMADANTRATSLVGSGDCKFDAGCFRLEYDLANRKEGWAGFAWQVVPQGERWNWGEHKGLDLSGRGYKSFRVWGKLEPGPSSRLRVEFKSGGNVEPKYSTTNRATYIVSSGLVTVDGNWNAVCLDLSRSDLRNVVSPFTVVISGVYNPPVRISLNLDGASYSTLPCTNGK